MNENELKLLWQSTNKKLEESLTINKNNTEDIIRLKVQNFLSSMKPIKIFTLSIGILWVIVLGIVLVNLFVNAYDNVSLFFLYSATIQVLLTAIAVGIYINQLDLIYNIDFSKPVIVIQQKLSKLKLSTLAVTRILFLQLPVWTTFYWNEAMFEKGNLSLWVIQVIITLLFTYFSLWLFFNIKYENRNKRWFQFIFRGREWQPILQSMELINRIQNYQDQEIENASH
jgi:hypothetical protein